jgi:predicted metal-binding membrane protein
MRHMDLVSMAMPSIGAWGLADLLIIFAMWAIMMIAMMVPSVTPMLLTFATINRTRHAKGRVFVSVWVFLAGYVASWTGFSFVATLAQWGGFLHIPAKRSNPGSRRQSGLGSDPDFSQFPNDFVHIHRLWPFTEFVASV